jgi:hypothetical protein
MMVLRQLAGAESLERSTLHSACIVIFDSSSPNLTRTELNTSQHSQSHWSSVKLPSRMSSGPCASIAWSQFHHFAACDNEDVSHTLMPEPPFWRPV